MYIICSIQYAVYNTHPPSRNNFFLYRFGAGADLLIFVVVIIVVIVVILKAVVAVARVGDVGLVVDLVDGVVDGVVVGATGSAGSVASRAATPLRILTSGRTATRRHVGGGRSE